MQHAFRVESSAADATPFPRRFPRVRLSFFVSKTERRSSGPSSWSDARARTRYVPLSGLKPKKPEPVGQTNSTYEHVRTPVPLGGHRSFPPANGAETEAVSTNNRPLTAVSGTPPCVSDEVMPSEKPYVLDLEQRFAETLDHDFLTQENWGRARFPTASYSLGLGVQFEIFI